MTKETLYWLAGLLEGEGSFLKGPPSNPNHPYLSLQMTDEDVIAKVAALFQVSYCRSEPRKSHWKPAFRVTVHGIKAVLLMPKLRPLMGERRKLQIDEALASYNPDPHALEAEGVAVS